MGHEIWKPIWDGQYEVSSCGRVRCLLFPWGEIREEPLIKKSWKGRQHGYLRLRMVCPDGIVRNFYIHKLVALAFLGDSNGLQVNHKDCNKLNNHIDNLEYVTPKENTQHARRMGRMDNVVHNPVPVRGEQHGMAKLTSQQVQEIRSKYIPRKYSQGRLSSEYGVSRGHIGQIVTRRRWEHL